MIAAATAGANRYKIVITATPFANMVDSGPSTRIVSGTIIAMHRNGTNRGLIVSFICLFRNFSR